MKRILAKVHGPVGIARLFFLLLVGSLAWCRPGKAFDIYYVCVGNAHYRSVAKARVTSFSPISGGNKSARKVAEALLRSGARDGVLFRSEEGEFVTKAQVLAALREVIAKAKKSPNSLIVYYFVGHGVSEGFGWNHFSVPGDFVGSTQNVTADALAKGLLYTGEVYDLLETSKIPFVMLLDNCYEGKAEKLTSTLLSKTLRQNMTDVSAVLKHLNQFHEPNPVLFGTQPGTVVPTVPDPTNPGSNLLIGPLARRLLIVLDRAQRQRKPVTLGEFMKQMTSNNLDARTKPAVSFAQLSMPNRVFIPVSQRPATVQPAERHGSGRPRAEIFRLSAPVLPRAIRANTASSYFSYLSEPDEWVGQGQARILRGAGTRITVQEDRPGRLCFKVEGAGEEWDLEFESPAGAALAPGTYSGAARAGFQLKPDAGFAASSRGRGCNELAASFVISHLKRDATGRLRRFQASFQQRCDERRQVLSGSLVFDA